MQYECGPNGFSSASQAVCDYRSIINTAWTKSGPQLVREMKERLDIGDIYILYDVQLYTNNLLRYASINRNYNLLNELSQLYIISYNYLQQDDDGGLKWIYTDNTNNEICNYINKEIPLISSQFLFVVAELIHYITLLETIQLSPDMKMIVEKFVPVLASFYDRWSPCFLDWIKTASAAPFPPVDDSFSFSVPVSDDLMFLIAGMTHLLAARANASESVDLSMEHSKRYLQFIDVGSKLLEKRLTSSELRDFSGNAVIGLNFDLGVWDGYEDYAYSGYDGTTYPTRQDAVIAQDVGWDISHASRFVNLFDTLYDNKAVTGLTFPDEPIMKGLANQLVYGSFNRRFDRPLFSTFMDGTNGWYRVGYAGRKNFGYAPYSLSDSIPSGGYGFWNRFNPDVGLVMQCIYSILCEAQVIDFPTQNTGAVDSASKSFVDRYYETFINQNSYYILMFLPTLITDFGRVHDGKCTQVKRS